MMFCKNCGQQIDDRAVICPHCGVAQNPQQPAYAAAEDDAPSMGFAVLCFFFPVVGLILYLVWKAQYPLKAKSCGKGAIIGFCVEVGLSLFLTIIWIALFAGAVNSVMAPLAPVFAPFL